MMHAPLVVGVDGSESSLQAVDWAADEAARHAAPLRLVYASLWERYEGAVPTGGLERPAGRVLAENIFGAAAERARLRVPDLAVSTEVRAEDATSALLREGASASAVVVGSRGRGQLASVLLGSVSLVVAARSACPVVVVRGDDVALASRHQRILLGVGSRDVEAPAVRFAFRDAAARGCALSAWRQPTPRPAEHTLITGDPAHSAEARAAALLDKALEGPAREYPDVRVSRATPEGVAAKILVERSAAADLLVVGARRQRSSLRGLACRLQVRGGAEARHVCGDPRPGRRQRTRPARRPSSHRHAASLAGRIPPGRRHGDCSHGPAGQRARPGVPRGRSRRCRSAQQQTGGAPCRPRHPCSCMAAKGMRVLAVAGREWPEGTKAPSERRDAALGRSRDGESWKTAADRLDDLQYVLAGQLHHELQGETVAIPSRIYNEEPGADSERPPLAGTQQVILHCLYSRHSDGRIRQRHLGQIVASGEPWVVPLDLEGHRRREPGLRHDRQDVCTSPARRVGNAATRAHATFGGSRGSCTTGG
ncbi:universal stress protein [Streptomyces anulatus]|uniref:universal stress protein n=1 Tax=Streptomyces anulatus TaxID=1892 RepID=UPI0035DAD81D